MNARMKRSIIGLSSALSGVVLVLYLSWPYWVVIVDGYGHRGVYRCSVSPVGASASIRVCVSGSDEIVFESRQENGTVTESWFRGGVFEYSRRTTNSGNGAKVLLTRALADSWTDVETVDAPGGVTGCKCAE